MPLPGLSAAISGALPLDIIALPATEATGSSFVVVTPSTQAVAGDFMVAVLAADAAGTWTGGTGWTEVYDQAANPSLRIATATYPAGSNTFTHSASFVTVGQIHIFRRATYDTIGSAFTLSGNGDVVIPQITSAGGFILAAVATQNTSGPTQSTPSGMTEMETTGTLSGSGVRLATFRQYVHAGATGTRTSTIGSAGGANSAGILIGVKLP